MVDYSADDYLRFSADKETIYTIANLFMLVKMLMFCRRMTTQSNGALGLMGIGLMSIV